MAAHFEAMAIVQVMAVAVTDLPFLNVDKLDFADWNVHVCGLLWKEICKKCERPGCGVKLRKGYVLDLLCGVDSFGMCYHLLMKHSLQSHTTLIATSSAN